MNLWFTYHIYMVHVAIRGSTPPVIAAGHSGKDKGGAMVDSAEIGFAWPGFAESVLAMERAGLVTRTFRRLDPDRQTDVIQAILQAAEERGLAYVSIKDVAHNAGVSVGSLYQYFGNREGMVAFTIALVRAHIEAVFAAAGSELLELPLRDALLAYIQGGCEWVSQEMTMMRLFAKAAYQGDERLDAELVTPIAASMRQLIRNLLEAARRRGELRPELDLDEAARHVHALTVVLCDTRFLPHLDHYLQLGQSEQRGPTALNASIDLIIHGLAAVPSSNNGAKP